MSMCCSELYQPAAILENHLPVEEDTGTELSQHDTIAPQQVPETFLNIHARELQSVVMLT